MRSIIRRDPFREMLSLRNAMDQLFDSAFVGAPWDWQSWTAELPLDVVENQDEYLVKASIPGINPDDLEVTFSDRMLTIKGEIKAEEVKEDVQYHLRERRYGSFTRSVTLPTLVKADAIAASYNAGVLTLRLPKTEEVKAKRISVRTDDSHKMIEGRAKDIAGKN